jgi:TatD DNase family protein
VIAPTFIDTHTHLDDDQFADELDAVINEATAAGVSAFVNIGYRPSRWQSTLDIAGHYPQVRFTLGLHPGHTDEWSEMLFADLDELVASARPVAIGEIGLDYYWTTDNKAAQRMSFERQVELAGKHGLPVVIHQRDAAADVADVLEQAPRSLGVILHSCDGDARLMDLAEERGWLIGVGGLMTRRQSEQLRSRLLSFPTDQILLETDSPYLIPAGVKARRNTPAMIPLIAERLAGLLDRDIASIAAMTTANAERAFGLVPSTSAP